MPDNEKPKTEEKPINRAERFVYTAEDAAHIFRLGKIGGVFNDTKSEGINRNIQKNVTKNNKKV